MSLKNARSRGNALILFLAILVACLLVTFCVKLLPLLSQEPLPAPTQSPTQAPTRLQHTQASTKPTTTPTTQPAATVEESVPEQEDEHPAGWPTITATDGRNHLGLPFAPSGIVLVNRLHPVNWDYVPQISSREGVLLAPEALAAYFEMREAARSAGLDFYYRSGYRDFGTQVAIRQQYLNSDPGGEEAVDRYSAPPGASEHQTGLAVDIDNGEGLSYDFDETPAGIWLHKHAYEYGFILRFPKGKEGITGYLYEPWHFRYVGKDVARDFGPHNSLTLEEYLNDKPAPSPFYRPNP